MAAPRQSIDLGRTFSTMFKVYKAALGKFIGISAVATVVTGVLIAVATVAFVAFLVTNFLNNIYAYSDPAKVMMSIIAPTVVFTIVLIVFSVVITWAGSIGNVAEADANLTQATLPVGRAIGIGFKKALSTVPIVLVIAVGVGLVTWGLMAVLTSAISNVAYSPYADPTEYLVPLLGSLGLFSVVMIVLVVVEYVVMVKCFLTFPIMVAEGLSLWNAVKRSWSMTKGTAGMIFLLIFLTTMIVGAASTVVSIPTMFFIPSIESTMSPYADPTAIFSSLGGLYTWVGLSSLAVSLFAMPIQPIMMAVVYRDRKALGL
jgi:hypothetical protein